jgi:uncharacterized protein
MTETVISVQGQHTAWYSAERATVVVSVATDGPERDTVFAAATASLDAVRETVTNLHDQTAGPITFWSADAVRVWSERPWNNEGKQLDPVHHAALDLTAKFKDFGALSTWLESIVSIPGVNVSSVAWTMTEASQTSAVTEVRSRAVKDAVAKASVYAQSIGLGSVTATAIADPGMLGDGGSGGAGGGPEMLRMAKFGGAADAVGGLELKPQRIEVSASVDARFIAR